ncbi:MAG: hemolysin family protein [Ilumatobacteraceae bacterium]|jgi:CBS domain containing-hemolysin-like protein|nr:hemolysin family protein [Ilumatobacteraceae bacterium]
MLLSATFTNSDAWVLVTVGILLVILTLLALAEMSLSRITKQKAEALLADGHKRGNILVRLASDPTRWVNPLLLTVNILQTLQATLTGVVANRVFGAPGVVIGVALNVVVFFVLAEAVPKTYAVLYSVRGATATAPLVSALAAFWPLRVASNLLIRVTNLIVKGKDLEQGPFISETEFLGIVEAAAKDSVIEAEEQELIESVIEFGDTKVREIMKPRQDIVTVDESATVSSALGVAIEHQFSRMPVMRIDDDDIDDVAGTVNTKDLMRLERDGRGGESVKLHMREAHVVPEGKPVAELMREMQRTQNHLTVVADEYGAFSGIVTLEDCLEELVGEIVDEHDDVDARFRTQPGGDVLVEGAVGVDDVNERLGIEISNAEYDTIGGYVFGMIGRVPRIGDGVEADGYRLCVEELDGRRVTMVRYVPRAGNGPTPQ